MKFRRPIIVVGLLAAVLVSSNYLDNSVFSSGYTKNYPVVVCPPTLPGLASQVSVSGKKTKYRYVASKKTTMSPTGFARLPITKDAILIDAVGITPTIWQSRSGSWAGGTLCSGPISSQWFVGGAADITSKGRLLIVNSGLSEAIIDVEVWSESGAQAVKVLTVPARTYSVQGLDSLAPGQQKLAIHVSARSGRVNAFVVDERGKGLRGLGGDMVNSVEDVSKVQVIPAIPNQKSRSNRSAKPEYVLRVLAPGQLAARISAEILSADGRFIPVGLNEREIKNGIVTEFRITPDLSASAFALRITSDEPIVSSVFSRVVVSGRSDFLWSTPAAPLQEMSIAVSGLTPLFVFAGDSIDVTIDTRLSNGKHKIARVKATDIATWRVPNSARVVTIVRTSKNVTGGALVSSINGYGYIPLTPGSVLTKAAIPLSNIRVLNP
ncbi:unannotated protein [freshwater metagenome]|uniref:Unannotated protein n=1 Tax=freshwater metagenome TaxID=449393 RepID=A0A6J6LR79_9ZZZZ|nr:hypothetical protein [Actinomycetota bacterium]MSW06268.1 hypothetical protein [Actinomycetota bacterium]MSX66433.1 hypothetical protein [Actinomycetota bacterium]MSZ62503.1 hypothetical protein [Actinomycetota bacterium]MTA70202.1 hypothetical protein [Actinomycetota bacterium]